MRRAVLTLAVLLAICLPASAQVAGPWSKIVFVSDTGPTLSAGSGSPENVVVAPVGSVYLQTDATEVCEVLWTKGANTDSTGWGNLCGEGGGTGSHNLLSATHSDTVANAAVRGAVIVANSTPAWARLTPNAAGQVLRFSGTDTIWSRDGSLLEDLNASEITSGTLDDARLSANVSLFGAKVDTSEIEDGAVTFAKWASNSCTTNQIPKFNGTSWACGNDETGGGGGGAPADASYWTSTAEGDLSNETNLGALSSG
ncbi:MAG TPA: hypothetical protein VF190_02740, partial [Rhodothermales bacterium]